MFRKPPSRPVKTVRKPAPTLLRVALLAVIALSGLTPASAAAGVVDPPPGDAEVGFPAPQDEAGLPASGSRQSSGPRGPVSIFGRARHAPFGGKVRVRGRSGLSVAGSVHLGFRAFGSGSWRTLKRIETNSSGHFHAVLRARRSGLIRATDRHGRDSAPVRLKVRSRIRLGRPAPTVKLGHALRLTGSVRPRGVRRIGIRISGGGERVVIRTSPGGRFAFHWRPSSAGDVRIRAYAYGNREAGADRSRAWRSSALRPGGASFYGPGLYGNGVACGGVLRPDTIGVAHKTLPCGTKVKFRYGHRLVAARVIDRGPYVAGRDWDLTEALRNRLGFGGVGTVWTNR